MLKKTITFEDLDGNEITEDFYFHMKKSDLVELQVSEDGGLTNTLRAVIEADDEKTLVSIFKKLILSAYGVRAADGRGFIKNDELRDSFAATDAYSQLFMELATNAASAAEFMNGIMPNSLAKEVDKATGGQDLSQMSKAELLAKLKELPDDS